MRDRAEVGLIARVIGPRLEGLDVVVIETETANATVTLKISRPAAAELCRSINAALAAANRSELPCFLSQPLLLPAAGPRRLRSLFRRRGSAMGTRSG